jgi:hypothetical protein
MGITPFHWGKLQRTTRPYPAATTMYIRWPTSSPMWLRRPKEGERSREEESDSQEKDEEREGNGGNESPSQPTTYIINQFSFF